MNAEIYFDVPASVDQAMRCGLRSCYRIYDWIMSKVFKCPLHYCSQCEGRTRHWVYRFKGLVYCQSCADEYVAKLQEGYQAFKL